MPASTLLVALLSAIPFACSLRFVSEANPPSLAIIISGLKARLILEPTLNTVVKPTARAGGAVDFYISLVGADSNDPWSWQGDPSPRVESLHTHAELRANLSAAIEKAGGRLAFFRQLDEQEAIDDLPAGNFSSAYMTEYNPSRSEVGKNVLRRWKSVEDLLRVMQTSKANYDFVLWEREDQFWTRPFSLGYFAGAGPKSVYVKDCLGWGGINDKSILMARDAANSMLTAYSAFWHDDKALASHNAEKFLENLAAIQKLDIMKVPFRRLPSTDAAYLPRSSPPRPCIKRIYSCENPLPKGAPDFCGDSW